MSVTVEQGTWGAWPTARLTTPMLQLEVVAGLGARIISLRDHRRGREWLLGGAAPAEPEARAWATEEAIFGGRQSFGWDECLPTVAVCADPREPEGPPLRDHGEQWARPSVASDAVAGTVEHTWTGARWPYRFSRRLSCPDDGSVLAEYSLSGLGAEPMPFLWSQHAVLALEAGSRVELAGVERVSQTWQQGIDLPAEPGWPLAELAGPGRSIDLGVVRTGEGWAAKLYARPGGPVSAVAPDGARLTLDWDRSVAPALGVWLAYGGWPPDGTPVEQVALEPTTSDDDHLAGALAGSRARWLAAGQTLTWWVRMTVA